MVNPALDKYTVDLHVDPLSQEALEYFLNIDTERYFKSDELYRVLETYTTLRGVALSNPLPVLEEPVCTRPVLVVHYDGKEKSTVYAAPFEKGSTTFETFGQHLKEIVKVADDEVFVFGWWSPGGFGSFFCDGACVPENDWRQYILTAWRTQKASVYDAVDCVFTTSGQFVVPTIVLPAPQSTHAMHRQAIAPYIHDQSLLNELCDTMVTINSRFLCSDNDRMFMRKSLLANPDLQAKGLSPISMDSFVFHPSAQPRHLVHQITERAKHVHHKEITRATSPEAVKNACLYNPKMYALAARVVNDTTIRITVATAYLYHPILLPDWQSETMLRFETSNLVCDMYRPKIHKASEFLMDLLVMPNDAPRAVQPQGLRVELKIHQLESLHKMLDIERGPTLADTILLRLPQSERENTTPYYFNPTNRQLLEVQRPPTIRAGFLSDDMGLGKTLTAIALCLANPGGPTLVLCPPSILGQWEHEIVSNTNLKVLAFHGRKIKGVTQETFKNVDIVLTTYATYRGHLELLKPYQWHRVIFDESHTLSGFLAFNAPQSDRRWCISATPYTHMGEQLTALRCPIRVSMAYLSSYTYYVLQPIMARHSKDQTLVDSPELPPLLKIDVGIPFKSEDEARLYEKAHKEAVEDLRRHKKDHYILRLHAHLQALRNICTAGKWSLSALFNGPASMIADYSLVAPHDDEDMCPICMNGYDQPTTTACNHWFCADCIYTALLKTGSRCPMCRTQLRQEQLRLGVLYGQNPPEESLENDGISCSSKLDALLQHLAIMRDKDPTAKALVFCPSSSSISEVTANLKQAGIGHRCINSCMPVTQRTNAIHAFQTNPKVTVFVLSLRSAAAGINLTAANHVFLLGPGVNRAAEEQAIGRAYRFGQKRAVTVARLYIKGTVEEAMLQVSLKTNRWTIDAVERVFDI